MPRILISWIALNNDFIEGKGTPNPDGPTVSVHKYFFNYTYHLLLSQASGKGSDTRTEFLVNYLKRHYKNDVRECYVNLTDVIDLKEISGKVTRLLLEHRNDEIDIFISPGTPAMQVAWYFAHLSLGLKTRLFQIRPAKFSKTKQPEQVWIDLERSTITSSLIIKEDIANKPIDSKFKITKSVHPIYELAKKVAAADLVTVLILGETGTGKEGLVRFIHENSPRSKGSFVAVNCSAMSDQLLESRLFGHKKGAFTGADKEVEGYFQSATGGTIFLDEIGDISPYMQQVLLRVLQEKRITKIGSTKEEPVDVRIISATNKDLIKLCVENKFRWDLFYRLSVVDLTLPPLRERGMEEIEEIFKFIIEKKRKDYNKPFPKISSAIKKKLLSYLYPGNIRELEGIIERIYATVDKTVTAGDLPKNFLSPLPEHSLKLIDIENNHIKKVLLECNKKIGLASQILGIARGTLDKRIRDYNL
jgi:two-component system, NtrC family, response regulator HydG